MVLQVYKDGILCCLIFLFGKGFLVCHIVLFMMYLMDFSLICLRLRKWVLAVWCFALFAVGGV
jgi:hypothetical protein